MTEPTLEQILEELRERRRARARRWVWWWVGMWAVNVAVLVPAAFLVPFRAWSFLAVMLFGVPEWIGLRRAHDALPPLTHVLQRYVPRWAIHLGIGALTFGAGAWWLGQGARLSLTLGALGGLYGWAQDHFDDDSRG